MFLQTVVWQFEAVLPELPFCLVGLVGLQTVGLPHSAFLPLTLPLGLALPLWLPITDQLPITDNGLIGCFLAPHTLNIVLPNSKDQASIGHNRLQDLPHATSEDPLDNLTPIHLDQQLNLLLQDPRPDMDIFP